MSNRKYIFGNTIGASLILLSISHWFPLGINVFELLGAFAHFTMLGAAVVFLISAFYRKWLLASSSAIAVVMCGALVLPHFSILKTSEVGAFSVGQFNMYHGNTSPQKVFEEMRQTDVDVLVIQELNAQWQSVLDSTLKKEYPFYVEEPWDECCYGIGLYSKSPILEEQIIDLEGTPAIRVMLNVNGQIITIVTLHARPPVFPNETAERDLQLKKVALMAKEEEVPMIVFGDLNIVPWDAVFKSFLEVGGLTAVRNGLQLTFPMDFGFPLIPIDHITYSQEWSPTAFESVPISGSDHKGIVGSFKLN